MAAQIINLVLGIWLMSAPGILGYNGVAADNDHIVGPVVASFAIIAMSGCTRGVSRYNLSLGGWLLLAPWILNYENDIAIVNDMTTGLSVTVFSFFKRKTSQQYGGGWSVLWRSKNHVTP